MAFTEEDFATSPAGFTNWQDVPGQPGQEVRTSAPRTYTPRDFTPDPTPPEPPPAAAESSWARRWIADPLLYAAQGVIGLPEAAVGIADIPTFGAVGKVLEAGGYGFQPKIAREWLETLKSPEERAAARAVSETPGFWGKIEAAVEHPSVILGSIIESVPQMLGGAAIGRKIAVPLLAKLSGQAAKVVPAAAGALTKAAPYLATGAGEAAITSGQIAEGIRQESPSGYLTPKQAALATTAGLATGAIGAVSGRLARALGIVDPDIALTLGRGAALTKPQANLAKRVIEGFVTEGLFEELPQSAQEQWQQNLATGRPAGEGVVDAAVLGLLTGGVMGAGFNLPGGRVRAAAKTEPAATAVAPPAPAARPGPRVYGAPLTFAQQAARAEEDLRAGREPAPAAVTPPAAAAAAAQPAPAEPAPARALADPAAVAKELGFEFELRSPMAEADWQALTDEQKKAMPKAWTFHDRNAADKSPTAGLSFQVPLDATREEILAALEAARKGYTPTPTTTLPPAPKPQVRLPKEREDEVKARLQGHELPALEATEKLWAATEDPRRDHVLELVRQRIEEIKNPPQQRLTDEAAAALRASFQGKSLEDLHKITFANDPFRAHNAELLKEAIAAAEAAVKPKKAGKPFTLRPRGDNREDILDSIGKLGGIRPPVTGKEPEYEGWTGAMQLAAKVLVNKNTDHTPDTILDELRAIKAPGIERIHSGAELLAAVKLAVEEREALRKSEGARKLAESQRVDFQSKVVSGNLAKEVKGKHAKIPVVALRPGDTFQAAGQPFEVQPPDPAWPGFLFLKDADKFGTQQIHSTETLWVERGSFVAGPEHGEIPSELEPVAQVGQIMREGAAATPTRHTVKSLVGDHGIVDRRDLDKEGREKQADLLKRLMDEWAARYRENPTVYNLFPIYLYQKLLTGKLAKTYLQNISHINQVLAEIDEFQTARLSDLTDEDMTNLWTPMKDDLEIENRAPAFNARRNAFIEMLRATEGMARIPRDLRAPSATMEAVGPLTVVKKWVPAGLVPGLRLQSLFDKIRSFGKTNSQEAADLAELLAYTGLRISEVFDIQWGDVDTALGTIRVKKPLKQQRGRKPPYDHVMNPALRSLILRLQQERPAGASAEDYVSQFLVGSKTANRINEFNEEYLKPASVSQGGYVKPVTSKDFRHFWSSLGKQIGVSDVWLAQMHGRKAPKVEGTGALPEYLHYIGSLKPEADKFVFGTRAEKATAAPPAAPTAAPQPPAPAPTQPPAPPKAETPPPAPPPAPSPPPGGLPGGPAPALVPELPVGAGLTREQLLQALQGQNSAGFPVRIISKADAVRIARTDRARGSAGFFQDNTVYLVIENLEDAAQAQQILRHEVAHGLLRTPEGRESLRVALRDGFRLTDEELAAQLGRGYEFTAEERAQMKADGMSDQDIAGAQWWRSLDEFIAVSREQQPGLFRRVVEAIRVFLSRFGLRLTNEETARAILRAAESGRGPAVVGGDLPETAFALPPVVGNEPDPDGAAEVIEFPPEAQGPGRQPVQVAGSAPQTYTVWGNDMLTPAAKLAGEKRAQKFMEDLGIPGDADTRTFVLRNGKMVSTQRRRGTTDMNMVYIIDPARFPGPYEIPGQRLLDTFYAEARKQGTDEGDPGYVAALANMVRKNFRKGNLDLFSPELKDRLLRAVLSDATFKAQQLRALTGLGESIENIEEVARNFDFALKRILGESFGGAEVRSLMQQVLVNFRHWFTDTDLQKLLEGSPNSEKARADLQAIITRVMALKRRDEGGHAFRQMQRLFSRKFPKTWERLESDAKGMEAVNKMVQQLLEDGIRPIKPIPPGKLTPLQTLGLMFQPETAAKIKAVMKQAVEDGLNAAGKKWAESQPVTGPERAAEFAAGEMPTPEEIAEGLKNPDFAFWKILRDEGLGYDPITVRLAQAVITEKFKGTKFLNIYGEENKAPERPPRKDLNALAKESDEAKDRAIAVLVLELEQLADDNNANGKTRQEVADLVAEELQKQITKAEKRVRDSFLEPPLRMKPNTDAQRVGFLLNAKLASDPRFRDPRVVALLERVEKQYAPATNFDTIATQTKDEKALWLTDTAAQVIQHVPEIDQMPDDSEFRLFAEQVILNDLSARLQKAEERLVARVLGQANVKLGTQPAPTPEALRARLQDWRDALEGAINAGLLGPTVQTQDVVRKATVQRLLPSLENMIRQALNTPVVHQKEYFKIFAENLVNQLNVDPADAKKAADLLEAAYADKFKVAQGQALDRALANLAPKELRTITGPKPRWKIIEEAVRAGAMDDLPVLEAIAKAAHWAPVTPAIRAKFKELVAKIDDLRELSPAQQDVVRQKFLALSPADQVKTAPLRPEEIEAIKNNPALSKDQFDRLQRDPAALAEAIQQARVDLVIERERSDKQATFEGEIIRLKKELEARWAAITRPINWRTAQGRENFWAAAGEVAAANLLFKAGFPVRQFLDIFTQAMLHPPLRALGTAYQQYQTDVAAGKEPHFLEDANILLRDAYKTQLSHMREALASAAVALKGTQAARNIERLQSGIAAFDRVEIAMEELRKAGKPVQAFALRILTTLRLAYRVASAFDNLHGTPAHWQEMRQLAYQELRQTMPPAVARLRADEILGISKANWAEAMSTARQHFAAAGQNPSMTDLRGAAANLTKARAYQTLREAGMPADEFERRADYLQNVIGWNERESSRSAGGAIAEGSQILRGVAQRAPWWLPIQPLSAIFTFGNAIGISINRTLAFTPAGFAPSLFGVEREAIEGGTIAKRGSPFFRTPEDRAQRKMEAAFGSSVGGLLLTLAIAGIIKPRNKWPKDKEEREMWERNGHRPGTVELPVPGGFIPISMSTGPLTLVRPYLAAGGAVRDLIEARDKEQSRLNAEAERTGQTPGKAKPLAWGDLLGVAGEAGQAALFGGRTAAGLVGAFTDYGIPNPKKSAASIVSAYTPGAPALQEIARMSGVRLDAKMASFTDFLTGLPTSGPGALAVNMLGDRVGTNNDLQRVVQTLTGGSYPFVANNESTDAAPYRTLFETGYRPPSISAGKGYDINGTIRPMSEDELVKYTNLRGKYFKEELSGLGAGATKAEARSAYRTANERALSELGVSAPAAQSAPRATAPRATQATTSSGGGGGGYGTRGGGNTGRVRSSFGRVRLTRSRSRTGRRIRSSARLGRRVRSRRLRARRIRQYV